MPSRPRILYQSALLAVLGTAVLGSTLAIARRGPDYAFFDPLIDVKAILSERYVEALDEQALQAGAIRGMIDTLSDPYTFFVPPEETREFTKGLTGEYVGIGVSILPRDGWLTVVTPLEDSPAIDAGIMPDDRIVEIEGKSAANMTPDEAIVLLTGTPGTAVRIVIERKGERIPLTITRQRIVTRTVKGFHREGAQGEWNHLIDPARRIAYIRLTQFNPGTAEELEEALEKVGAQRGDLGGLILDVRTNPGGLLGQAIAVSDLFLREGVIVSTRGRAVQEEVYRAKPAGTLPDFPIAVLIDDQSASASEIVAAALAENGRAIVVGARTFGKGSVQAVLGLPSVPGAQLKLTEQRYYSPNGRSLHRASGATEWGVDPTPGYYVPVTDEERLEMLRIRRDQEIIRAGAAGPTESWSDPEWILGQLKDQQLAAALRAVQGRVTSGEWTATGLPGLSGEEHVLKDLARVQLARERILRDLVRVDQRLEELAAAAGNGEAAPAKDLWAGDFTLTGGQVIITDAAGATVATLKITGEDLERWLLDAPVE